MLPLRRRFCACTAATTGSCLPFRHDAIFVLGDIACKAKNTKICEMQHIVKVCMCIDLRILGLVDSFPFCVIIYCDRLLIPCVLVSFSCLLYDT